MKPVVVMNAVLTFFSVMGLCLGVLAPHWPSSEALGVNFGAIFLLPASLLLLLICVIIWVVIFAQHKVGTGSRGGKSAPLTTTSRIFLLVGSVTIVVSVATFFLVPSQSSEMIFGIAVLSMIAAIELLIVGGILRFFTGQSHINA